MRVTNPIVHLRDTEAPASIQFFPNFWTFAA